MLHEIRIFLFLPNQGPGRFNFLSLNISLNIQVMSLNVNSARCTVSSINQSKYELNL